MNDPWPVVDGAYVVGDPDAPVAICTLTTERLVEPAAQLPGVAIAGQVFTANEGIERIVTNLTANPAIRFLVVCGKDSKIFRPGQSLGALLENGIDSSGHIMGAAGYDPVLPASLAPRVDFLRRQIEVIDRTGDDDLDALRTDIADLVARNPGPFTPGEEDVELSEPEPVDPRRFETIRPGGQKQPLQYDPKGYFVITLDHEKEQIVLRHHLPDHSPAHEMRGRVAASMFLGLVREGLVSQLSHAGYLGAALAKAAAALRLDLRYAQDRPLKRIDPPPEAAPAVPPMPRIGPPMAREQLAAAELGADVSIVLAVTSRQSETAFAGAFLEPDAKNPFNTFDRTDEPVGVTMTPDTKIAMGVTSDIVAGGIVRVNGKLDTGRRVAARSLAILSAVATVR